MGPGDLTGPVITAFLVDRRRDYSNHYSLQALGPTLGYLRRVGLAPAAEPTVPVGAVEEVLARFGHYLLLDVNTPGWGRGRRRVAGRVGRRPAPDKKACYVGWRCRLTGGVAMNRQPALQ